MPVRIVWSLAALSLILALVSPTLSTTAAVVKPSSVTALRSVASVNADCLGAKDTRTTTALKKAPFTVCGVTVITKHHRVSAAYVPHLVTVAVRSTGISRVRLQAVAGGALKKLFVAAKKAGYVLTVRSAYRSYATQKSWYVAGSTLVAPPGASEHQSGLAADLAWIHNGRLIRGTSFGVSRAGKWVHAHAAAYGFIQRYPKGSQKITHIRYEPWHYRYVGTDVAAGVNKTSSKTLEKYLKISA
jgi:zinc D-Ala-D-Ala carboxypeptidase